MTRKIITIDGFAGTGKSTLSKILAQKLGFAHLNSGLLYRAVATFLMNSGIDPELVNDSKELQKLKNSLKNTVITLDYDVNETNKVIVLKNGKEYVEDFFNEDASRNASKFSLLPEVRDFLMESQREAFPKNGLVAEGRDMGTVVFPEADVKFFINVDSKIRAKRRLDQTQPIEKIGDSLVDTTKMEQEILKEIIERDTRDSERAISPTIPAKNAIFIDNSSKSLTEVIDEMYHHVLSKI